MSLYFLGEKVHIHRTLPARFMQGCNPLGRFRSTLGMEGVFTRAFSDSEIKGCLGKSAQVQRFFKNTKVGVLHLKARKKAVI